MKKVNEDQIWETIIRQNENELLAGDTPLACDVTGEPPIMRARDIIAMTATLAELHKCQSRDINFCFEAYIGDDGKISEDEMRLIFRIEQLADGCITNHIIHTMPVQIPQDVKLRARAMIEELTRKK